MNCCDEVWTYIDGFENYLVSSFGRVWNVKRHKFMKLRKEHHAWRLGLTDSNGVRKFFFIHRLVMDAFVPNPDPKTFTQINHIDEDTSNNAVENLEWCDAKYNCNYGTRNQRMGLGVSKALKLHPNFSKRVKCVETGITYISIREASRITGISVSHISLSCKGYEFKRADNQHWIYA